jgi:hypothetical protein
MIKKKPSVGDSKKTPQGVLLIEELFTADNTRWIRCSKFRKMIKVTYYNTRYTEYVNDNVYMSELEWIRLK